MVPTTVIIPTKNRLELLKRAVNSVLNQTTPVSAVIVVDDGSQPPVSIEDVKSDIVTVYRHSTSAGPSGARNSGVRLATTQWVTFLDDDDELDPEFASELSKVIDGPLRGDFIWSGVRFRRSDGSTQGVRTFTHMEGDQESLCREALDVGTGYGLTVLTDRFRAVGEFDDRLSLTEDTDFIIRAMKAGMRPAVIGAAMVQITNHSGARLTNGHNDEKRIEECRAILAKHETLSSDLPYVEEWMQQRIVDLQSRVAGGKFVTKCEGFSTSD